MQGNAESVVVIDSEEMCRKVMCRVVRIVSCV